MRWLPSFLLFTVACGTPACGELAADAPAASDADAGASRGAALADGGVCCPRDSSTSGCMHLGGSVKHGCGESCDFWCSTNWRVETDEDGCEAWRYDMRQPAPDEDGLCIRKKTPPPTTASACQSDRDCNGDPSVSGLWGTCFYGVCMCKQSFTVQPNGKCNTAPAPDCPSQGGTCRQQPARCHADELAVGTPPGDMSCGDIVEAVCCEQRASCKGPQAGGPDGDGAAIDFVCCAPNDAISEPLCVNGWQTCPAGFSPVKGGSSRCGG